MSQEDFKDTQKNKKRSLIGKRKWVVPVALLVVILLVAGVAGGYFVQKKRAQNICSGSAAGTAFFEEAAGFLAIGSSVSELRPYAEKVFATKGYEKSASCLYVVLVYSIDLSDPGESRLYLDKLTAIYNPEQGYDKGIEGVALTLDELKPIVEFLEQQAKPTNPGLRYAPQVSEQ